MDRTWLDYTTREHTAMTVERYIRLIAGTFVMGSLALGHWIHPYWYLFTAFVGLNLFQSALTKWCLMEDILRKLGIGCSGAAPDQG